MGPVLGRNQTSRKCMLILKNFPLMVHFLGLEYNDPCFR